MQRLGILFWLVCVVLTILHPENSWSQEGDLNRAAVGIVYVVNTTDDVDDGVCNGVHCSLREAINAANATPGSDKITFDIPGAGPHSIRPVSELPAITDPIVVDGFTQPGAAPNANPPEMAINAVYMIELDGSDAGLRVNGLTITGGGTTIRGLVINRFAEHEDDFSSYRGGIGILIENGGNNLIAGNFIGTDVTGANNRGNTGNGIVVKDSPDNTIGGDTPEARNLISGNGAGEYVDGVGMTISGSASINNVIQGNFIGTSADGTGRLRNAGAGIGVFSVYGPITVGGATNGARNLVSGNGAAGIQVHGPGATVQGNFIGTDLTGTRGLGNSYAGILSYDGMTIGGDSPGEGNVISGNSDYGIRIQGDGYLLQGNLIGTDVTGTVAIGNGNNGITAVGGHYTIGGTAPGARNIISANGKHGLSLSGPSGSNNVVQGNYIGTDITGTVPLGNRESGIRTNAVGLTIGGTEPGAGNVIAASRYHGIEMMCCGDIVVAGNAIGTDAGGTLDLGNSGHGIWVRSSGHTIGGTAPNAGNMIANNGGGGVVVSSAARTAVHANSIFSNGQLGIDLNDDGVTPNDVGDGDFGANNLQNFPVLASASLDDGIIIEGSLNSSPSETFVLEFFANSELDASGHGEGKVFLGSEAVTSNASGEASFTATLDAAPPSDSYVAATMTDAQGNTSEFSLCVEVVAIAVIGHLDIKPGTCPNPLNIRPFDNPPDEAKQKKGGVLPVAVLGTLEFDVSEIDVGTVMLEGVPPLRHSTEDVSTPGTGGEECRCMNAGPDGYADLTLKFQNSEIVASLGEVSHGDAVSLTLTGQLDDGTPFEATDCVSIIGDPKPRKPQEPHGKDEPKAANLSVATPNPFNPVTLIHYYLPREADVDLVVFDVKGRLVERLVNGRRPAGEHVAEFAAHELPSGIYFYRIDVGSYSATRKMILLK